MPTPERNLTEDELDTSYHTQGYNDALLENPPPNLDGVTLENTEQYEEGRAENREAWSVYTDD